MNQFYVSIIFIGITLIVVSLVWIAYDRKKSHDYMTQIDMKKEELVGIIADAEQMVEEMNKFSDYIVTQMEIKNEEMCSNFKHLEDRIKQVNSAVVDTAELKLVKCKSDRVVNGNTFEVMQGPDMTVLSPSFGSDLVIDSIRGDNVSSVNNHSGKTYHRTRDKVIPLNSKHKEVIQLAQTGMNDTEIAKSLKMGKGEVQLILGMNR